jgi:hypothetical protein
MRIGARCIAHADGASWVVWSWIKGRSAEGSYASEWNAAMRAAVRDKITKFFSGASKQCELCGSESDLTVDHRTVPFSALARQSERNIETLANDGDGRGWYLRDPCGTQHMQTIRSFVALAMHRRGPKAFKRTSPRATGSRAARSSLRPRRSRRNRRSRRTRRSQWPSVRASAARAASHRDRSALRT